MATIKGMNEEVQFLKDSITCSGSLSCISWKPREFYNGKSRSWQDAFADLAWERVERNRKRWQHVESFIYLYLDLHSLLLEGRKPEYTEQAFQIILDEDKKYFKHRVFNWLDENRNREICEII